MKCEFKDLNGIYEDSQKRLFEEVLIYLPNCYWFLFSAEVEVVL